MLKKTLIIMKGDGELADLTENVQLVMSEKGSGVEGGMSMNSKRGSISPDGKCKGHVRFVGQFKPGRCERPPGLAPGIIAYC